ncbi:MAG: sulfocyanin-like copper-binding protein [Gaiellaceae bacterium]
MRGRWLFMVLVSLVAVPLALGLTACGGSEEAAAVDTSDATEIHAKLAESSAGEYTFTLDADSAPAGTVLFEIENLGELPHEFEVIKTDVGVDDLPVEAGKANAEAEGGEEIGEVEDIEPGDKTELAVELEAGSYLILCNLPGHYEQGMVLAFTVE